MVRKELIQKRLKKLVEYLDILRGLQVHSYDEFIGNPQYFGSTERFLQLAIEVINDIGSHLVADLGLGEINWYSDIPTLLTEKGYIAAEMRDKWIRMIGFRNILVHEYLEIDRRIVYDVLQHGLDDMEALEKQFVQFL